MLLDVVLDLNWSVTNCEPTTSMRANAGGTLFAADAVPGEYRFTVGTPLLAVMLWKKNRLAPSTLTLAVAVLYDMVSSASSVGTYRVVADWM